MSSGKRVVFVGVSIDLCLGCRSIEIVNKEGYCIKCSGNNNNYGDRLEEGFRELSGEEEEIEKFDGFSVRKEGKERWYEGE